MEAEIAHKQKKHDRRPVIAGHSGKPELSRHVQYGWQAAHIGDENEARGHERKAYRHAEEEQAEHERHAENAERYAADVRHAVQCQPQAGQKNAERERQSAQRHCRTPFVQHGGQLYQHVAQHGQRAHETAKGGEKQKRRIRDVPCGRGPVLPGQGIAAHGIHTPYKNGQTPCVGRKTKSCLALRAELSGNNVHGNMSLIPLSLGQPAEIHDDHEQFRELHGAAYGAVKEITQKHIQKGQKHHEHKQTHGGGIPRGTKRAGLFQNARRAEQNGGKGDAAFFCGMGRHKRILAVRNRREAPSKRRTEAARAVPRMGPRRRENSGADALFGKTE